MKTLFLLMPTERKLPRMKLSPNNTNWLKITLTTSKLIKLMNKFSLTFIPLTSEPLTKPMNWSWPNTLKLWSFWRTSLNSSGWIWMRKKWLVKLPDIFNSSKIDIIWLEISMRNKSFKTWLLWSIKSLLLLMNILSMLMPWPIELNPSIITWKKIRK